MSGREELQAELDAALEKVSNMDDHDFQDEEFSRDLARYGLYSAILDIYHTENSSETRELVETLKEAVETRSFQSKRDVKKLYGLLQYYILGEGEIEGSIRKLEKDIRKILTDKEAPRPRFGEIKDFSFASYGS